MQIHVFTGGPAYTHGYLLSAPERGEAVLVDAPENVWDAVAPVLDEQKCRLAELWLTHGHWDHTQGAAEVVRRTGAKVRAHRADQPLIETPEVMGALLPRDMEIEPVKVDAWMAQGDRFEALGEQVEVRHVPGHCPGNILFWFPAQKMAVVGDALFAGSIGRTDLPGGDMRALDHSIRAQIYTLPDDTRVFPGHGDDTTVGVEKKTNPYVRE
ncbi:MAG: MBL fold metallo-hydrolase [Opitutaceae bacterium]|jgi:glyoxylase-like metal-dependent hydrolase (beta-lactamase superfamily II)|nr:MBL fold metallo-hydrolase [Opitutaceae bacterium]